jgi:hypothetical protein
MDKLTKLRKMDMRFGMWNVTSLHRASLLMAGVKEISKYKLDLVGLKRSDGTETAPKKQVNIHFSMGIMN